MRKNSGNRNGVNGGKFEMIESINLAESSDLSCRATEKEVLLPITQFLEKDTLIILLSA